jgi:hypothetical protein
MFVRVGIVAVVLAGGITYAMVRSEKPVAMLPPIIAADRGPATIAPSAAPADNDQRKRLSPERIDGVQGADQMKLVTPGNGEVAEVPASSGDDNNRVFRVIAPGVPGYAAPAKADDAPASADRPAPDVAAGGDDSGHSPSKAGTLVVGPVVGSKTAAEADAGKLSVPASPPVSPPATPPVDPGAAGASARDLSRETQTDAVINGKGLPIPINTDPLGINGGDISAGAVPKQGRSPEPVGVSMSNPSGAAPASDNGTAVADDASAVPAPQAKVPIPRPKPIVIRNKAGKPLPTPPSVVSSGDLH